MFLFVRLTDLKSRVETPPFIILRFQGMRACLDEEERGPAASLVSFGLNYVAKISLNSFGFSDVSKMLCAYSISLNIRHFRYLCHLAYLPI